MIQLRPYQQAAIDAVEAYWARGGGNPLIDLATGLGKSVVIAKLTHDLVKRYPDMRVLMLVHQRELVEQNFMALMRLWPQANAGIYSAGLGRRDLHHQITFASIQSVYKRGRLLGPRDLILIDEAHLVPAGGEGMYQKLLGTLREAVPDLRVAGFTATPYRMDSGRLDQGDNRLFDEVVYSYGVGPGIEDGWLSPLTSKPGDVEIDVSGVGRRGGEFIPGALEAAANVDAITQAAVSQMIRMGASRRSWLVFCTGVDHAFAVRDALRASGVLAETITGETPAGERAGLIKAFKAGRIRALTNANVLTTGFDAPNVDLIALLRPTLSTGLYVQMIGRGTRKAEGKENCLVLDYAGVIRRHGPVDMVEAAERKARGEGEKVGVDTVNAKACPNCDSLVGLSSRTCKDCGYEWPRVEKPGHEDRPDDAPILSSQAVTVSSQPVLSWHPARHTKFGSPDSVRVTYLAGLMSYPEWLAFEHGGYAADKARRWWAKHGGASPPPQTVDEALARWGELTKPETIMVRPQGRWWQVVGRTFGMEAAA